MQIEQEEHEGGGVFVFFLAFTCRHPFKELLFGEKGAVKDPYKSVKGKLCGIAKGAEGKQRVTKVLPKGLHDGGKEASVPVAQRTENGLQQRKEQIGKGEEQKDSAGGFLQMR